MDTISTRTILDRGSRYLGNHPDMLSKRIALALVLVDARAVKSIEAAVLAFRIWGTPGAQKHSIEVLLNLANEKAKANG